VEDVHAFPGHIACDAASRSELVVPVIRDGAVIAVIDLDSPCPDGSRRGRRRHRGAGPPRSPNGSERKNHPPIYPVSVQARQRPWCPLPGDTVPETSGSGQSRWRAATGDHDGPNLPRTCRFARARQAPCRRWRTKHRAPPARPYAPAPYGAVPAGGHAGRCRPAAGGPRIPADADRCRVNNRTITSAAR
jgi:hypothetical protein